MTLEIKWLQFNSLPEYLAVHGRVAAQRSEDQETSPPAARPAEEEAAAPAEEEAAAPAEEEAAAPAEVEAAAPAEVEAAAPAAPLAAPAATDKQPAVATRNDTPSVVSVAAAKSKPDIKMEAEHGHNEIETASPSATSDDSPIFPFAMKQEVKADVIMQAREQGCNLNAGLVASDVPTTKANAGSGTASPLGAKRKRDQAEGMLHDGMQRITSHAG
jgi:hypothetical protein